MELSAIGDNVKIEKRILLLFTEVVTVWCITVVLFQST